MAPKTIRHQNWELLVFSQRTPVQSTGRLVSWTPDAGWPAPRSILEWPRGGHVVSGKIWALKRGWMWGSKPETVYEYMDIYKLHLPSVKKLVPFHLKNLPKGRNSMYLEDPGMYTNRYRDGEVHCEYHEVIWECAVTRRHFSVDDFPFSCLVGYGRTPFLGGFHKSYKPHITG